MFTSFFAKQFQQKPDTELVIGRANAVAVENGTVKSVSVTADGVDRVIEADAIVVAAGPWTGKLSEELLGDKIGRRLGVTGHRAHSVVLHTKEQLTPHCLFTSMTLEDGSTAEPEVYTRPDGTTYM